MRKEPFTIGNYVHVYNRGSRKMPIVRDEADKWHFLEMLYYFNDESSMLNLLRELHESFKFDLNSELVWPNEWEPRKPIVKILAFILMENHFHLLLKETQENGIGRFMQKLGTGMANYFNNKYQESGGLFQGSYKAKTVQEDEYLEYLSVYIQVKNAFEMYPGGIEKAVQEFDKAYEFAINYSYGSLANFAGRMSRNSVIVEKELLGDMFPSPQKYKEFAKECIIGMDLDRKLELGNLTF